jgi:hypothetical protein
LQQAVWTSGEIIAWMDGKSKIEVNEKSLRVPVYVIRSGKSGLTLTCADSKHGFKVGTSPEQLQKFRAKLESLFVELVEKK